MLSRRLLRIKVVKALYGHVQCDGDNLMAAQTTLLNSVDATYNLYLLLLQLPVEIASNIRKMQEIAKAKHLATYEDRNPNTRFVDCKVVQLIENNDELNDYASAKGVNWSQYPDVVKEITANFIASEAYKRYLKSQYNNPVDDDVILLTDLFVEQLQSSEMLEEAIEAISISMSSDLVYALPLVMRTLSSIRNSS
ncbi:MAG: transcription termination factor, partial [Rikenellaceae bacterium]